MLRAQYKLIRRSGLPTYDGLHWTEDSAAAGPFKAVDGLKDRHLRDSFGFRRCLILYESGGVYEVYETGE